MRFTRPVSAMLVLGALVFPQVMGFAAAHDPDGHHHRVWPASHHATSVELIVHGHHHEPGTPLHQHTLVAAKPAALTTKLSLTLDLASSVRPTEALSIPATKFFALHADLAHGPPLASNTLYILRI